MTFENLCGEPIREVDQFLNYLSDHFSDQRIISSRSVNSQPRIPHFIRVFVKYSWMAFHPIISLQAVPEESRLFWMRPYRRVKENYENLDIEERQNILSNCDQRGLRTSRSMKF